MFSSLRGLKCQQTRFQDDFEALLYLAYAFIGGRLPWDIEFRERMRFFQGDQKKQLRLYSQLRIDMFEQFQDKICDQFSKLVPQVQTGSVVKPGELPNPFTRATNSLNMLNF
jgi:hypothetical protein